MLITIITFSLLFYWLLIETDYLRVNLSYRLHEIPDYSGAAGFRCYYRIGNKKRRAIDSHFREYNYNGHKNYDIVFQPGITEPLCGWQWLENHCGDLVNYQPRFALEAYGVKHNMVIKAQGLIPEVMKAVKPSRTEIKQFIKANA